jgi:hypothetical protein
LWVEYFLFNVGLIDDPGMTYDWDLMEKAVAESEVDVERVVADVNVHLGK